MCGIAGFFGTRDISPAVISNTLSKMKNRGPNAQKAVKIHSGQRHVDLLHSRLSIIDLAERADQPMRIGHYTLVFNGEIYNYREIREKLERQGIRFSTTSDTEVLLQAFIHGQESCLEQLEGMWAFAIYDHEKNELFLSRDRFGEKPLYLFETSDGIYFGSEVKLIRELIKPQKLVPNEQHVLRYLVNGYKALYKTKETFFEGLSELTPGTFMKVSADGKKTEKRYWNFTVTPLPMTTEEAVEGIRNRLMKSLELRLRADVPIAFCLSGGVDSSALVSIAAKKFKYPVTTFTIIDQDERYNEEALAKDTIRDLNCKSHFVHLAPEKNLNRMKQLIQYHDMPVSTISYYIHSFLSEEISRNGFRVVCSGTAADELFTGYFDHFNWHLYEVRNTDQYATARRDWEEGVGKVVRNPYLKDADSFIKNPNERGHIYLKNEVFTSFLNKNFDEPFYEENYCQSRLRNRMLNELFHEAVPPILHEDDLNSMMYSIENRSPFLDRPLFEFMLQVPDALLIQNGFGKYLLREAVSGILNDTVRLCRQKRGFNASILSVFDLDSKEVRENLLDDGPIYKLVQKAKIQELLTQKELANSDNKFLFSFINAALFLRETL